jgi:ketosteroid isomerase-like protein
MDDWESRINGKVTRGVSRFSIVFRKKNGEWKVIHEHFTKIA